MTGAGVMIGVWAGAVGASLIELAPTWLCCSAPTASVFISVRSWSAGLFVIEVFRITLVARREGSLQLVPRGLVPLLRDRWQLLDDGIHDALGVGLDVVVGQIDRRTDADGDVGTVEDVEHVRHL